MDSLDYQLILRTSNCAIILTPAVSTSTHSATRTHRYTPLVSFDVGLSKYMLKSWSARDPKPKKRQRQQPPAKISAPAYCTRKLGNLGTQHSEQDQNQNQNQDQDTKAKAKTKKRPSLPKTGPWAKVCVLCWNFYAGSRHPKTKNSLSAHRTFR